MRFSNLDRKNIVTKLKNEAFDVIVIGGGITGAGIALDATTRGMNIALLEMQDFAAGTSSRSTKLVHGGLRYLKQFEVKMVAEVGKERAIVYENGPHVTTPEWMLLPFHKGGTFGSFSTSIGLRVYDFLAGVKKSERRKMFSAAETLSREPLVKRDGLKGGGYYVEYRTDDARLTIEVLKQAVSKGATALNYSKVKNLIYKNGIVAGVLVEDLITGEEYEVHAKKVVNATGPWVDGIREMDDSKKGKTLKLSKGVHIVIDQSRFPLKQAIYFDTPDSRMVFAIPREGKTYVGTTDTFYNEDPINPGMTEEDRSYLLKAIHYMFPEVNVTEKDVESSWAGIRPLIHEEGKAPSEISRKDEIWESNSKLITIAGGKLTGYRKMAETIVDLLAEKFAKEDGRSFPGCQTKNLPISGGDVGGSANLDTFVEKQLDGGMKAGFTTEEARRLAYQYGSNVPAVFQLASEHKKEADQFGLPLELFAKLVYAIQYEAAATPIDFFNRRTGAILFDIHAVRQNKGNVIHYMRDQFKWNEQQTKAYTLQLEDALTEAVTPVK
ncbi:MULTISPECIES: glycerol-3-phosphate dehydrogenase/oxidase [unclassified Mesobacillus]|uniref:glycerol-3-phosphate dehydrogenase/oxidase n=1 Tax=unclassified Mesobacillus TaxID=2675270 RepID=UPI00203EC458|nr:MULTISPECIES: glycerol-3-phosphate dehydrogenase/oxidase [unclassified Mesobacillus]MCM3124239.1 glycerol-3-phosphate dehydrogenase/oxidase [Mesobacillus sp. MER 33]MCM3235051.1 glycerol-3-phosphate dehydrogenase/oxidase [Mesobacillus sp. MER 48]